MPKDNKKSLRHLSESYISQIHVLRAICTASNGGAAAARPRTLDIGEVAELSGLKDEKETLRFLYILEGHKLVTPFPPGDFTSKAWQVTDEGLKAWKTISSELDLAA